MTHRRQAYWFLDKRIQFLHLNHAQFWPSLSPNNLLNLFAKIIDILRRNGKVIQCVYKGLMLKRYCGHRHRKGGMKWGEIQELNPCHQMPCFSLDSLSVIHQPLKVVHLHQWRIGWIITGFSRLSPCLFINLRRSEIIGAKCLWVTPFARWRSLYNHAPALY